MRSDKVKVYYVIDATDEVRYEVFNDKEAAKVFILFLGDCFGDAVNARMIMGEE